MKEVKENTTQNKTIEVSNVNGIKMPIPALCIQDLHKSYGNKKVLTGVNLIVNKGEIFGIVGKNGIGKTTTIDCIVGLKEADSGKITIYGINNKKDALKAKKLIGYVPSEPTTYEMMSGNEYLEFIASCFCVNPSEYRKNYEYLIDKFAMKAIDMERKIREYSYGMKQKIGLMASLIHNPTIWILDEPTVGLDIVVYETLLKMIKEFTKNGRTVFITSHNIDFVSKICDRVAIINNGQVSKLIDLNVDQNQRQSLSKTLFDIYEDKI